MLQLGSISNCMNSVFQPLCCKALLVLIKLDHIQQRPSCEINRFLASQEILHQTSVLLVYLLPVFP